MSTDGTISVATFRTGVAATFITTLSHMMSEGSKVAVDSEQTRSMITSLWMMAENVGASLGTFAGGVAYDEIGFEWGLVVIAGIQMLSLIIIPIMCFKNQSNR